MKIIAGTERYSPGELYGCNVMCGRSSVCVRGEEGELVQLIYF